MQYLTHMVQNSIALLPLLILLLLFAGLIVGIVLWFTGGKGGTKGEMSCGGCGYPVRGLETLNCPECGADLRRVGINREQGGGKRGIGIALTICCGGILLLGCGSVLLLFSDSSSSQAPTNQLHQSTPSTVLQSLPAVDPTQPEFDEDDSLTPAIDPAPDASSP